MVLPPSDKVGMSSQVLISFLLHDASSQQVLNDKDKRQAYDRFGKQGLDGGGGQGGFHSGGMK